MSRLVKTLRITAYALPWEVAALAVGLPLFVGWEGVIRHLGFAILLCLVGLASVFLVSLLGLRHGQVILASRGSWLGMWAGVCFYLFLLLMFGALPAAFEIANGRSEEAADYFGAVFIMIMSSSYGLPVAVGIVGGAVYGWLSGRHTCLKKSRL